jgi:ABC-2 type transport system ATP-binding protein
MLDTDGNSKASVVAGRHPSALSVVGLEKSYGATVALAGVDLTVEAGTILGLLGPNGAGKTSIVSIVAGLRRADAGRVEVCGVDVVGSPQAARRLIGIAPQDTGVYLPLRVRENLRFFAGLAGLSRAQTAARIEEVADALGLSALLDRRASQLSGGERRRVHTAIALLHRPALVLLDEPTTGADVVTRAQILELVRGLARDGSAVVYSTHYLHEIEALEAEVAFIDRGRIVARGSTEALIRSHGSSALLLTFVDSVPAAARVEGAVVDGAVVRIPADDPAARAAQLLPDLGADARLLRSIEIVRPSLESVYLSVTGRRYAAEPAEAVA